MPACPHGATARGGPQEERARQLQAEVLKALAHPTRIQILELLRGGERCVCEIEPALGLGQANVSQHLAILRAANLVTARRQGMRVNYAVSDRRVYRILDGMRALARDQRAEEARALRRPALGA